MAVTRISDFEFPMPWMIALLCVLSLGIIGGAFAFEYAGYKPCELCLLQRYAYYFVIPVSAVAFGLVYQGQIRAAQLLLIACAIAYILNAALGGYHSGVEWGWWEGPTACTGQSTMQSLMALDTSKLIESIKTTKVVPCDKPAWTLFGISLAGFNFLISLGLATLALVATRRLSL